MKAFSFPLDGVLEFRRRQLENLEARLSEISHRQSQLRQLAASRREQALHAVQQAGSAGQIYGADLQATQSWMSRLESESQKALADGERLEQDRQRLLAQLVEMRRRVRLLEKLRSRKVGSYQAALSREEESQATEFFLAARAREKRI